MKKKAVTHKLAGAILACLALCACPAWSFQFCGDGVCAFTEIDSCPEDCGSPPPPPTSYTCVIWTTAGHTCDGAKVSVTNTGGSTRTAVLNVTNGGSPFNYVVLRTETCNAQGFSFHVGDSVSNDGGGGDHFDARHDAEIQVLGSAVTVFMSEYGSPSYTTASGPPSSGCAVQEYRIADHYVYVDPNTAVTGGEVAWLTWFFDFPTYNEYDAEDLDLSEQPQLYLGLNRTYRLAARSGSGLKRVCVYLSQVQYSTPVDCPF